MRPTNENAAEVCRPQAAQIQHHCEAILNDQASPVKHFKYPESKTVKGRVLGAALRGDRLTSHDCLQRFASSRLSGHIHKLREIGWPIHMVEQTVTTCDAGRPATIGIYFLDSGVISDAGDIGREYALECLRIEIEHRAIGRGNA